MFCSEKLYIKNWIVKVTNMLNNNNNENNNDDDDDDDNNNNNLATW